MDTWRAVRGCDGDPKFLSHYALDSVANVIYTILLNQQVAAAGRHLGLVDFHTKFAKHHGASRPSDFCPTPALPLVAAKARRTVRIRPNKQQINLIAVPISLLSVC